MSVLFLVPALAVFLGADVLAARLLRAPGMFAVRDPQRAPAPFWRMALVACAGPLALYLASVALLLAAPREPEFTTRVLVAPGMPAQAAGLRDGDEVVAVDGTKVVTFNQVRTLVTARASPGRSISLDVRRADGSVESLTATMDERQVLGLNAQTPIPSSLARTLLRGLAEPFHAVAGIAAGTRRLLSGASRFENVGGPVLLYAGPQSSTGAWLVTAGVNVALMFALAVVVSGILLALSWARSFRARSKA